LWLCGREFLDAKKKRKSCGFILSLNNFEVKMKERSFQHLAFSNEVSRLHPETTREISLRNFVTPKKKKVLVVSLLFPLLGGGGEGGGLFVFFFFFKIKNKGWGFAFFFFFFFLFFFHFKQWGGVFLRFSFEDKLLFFSSNE
jgi:hypothetical protein